MPDYYKSKDVVQAVWYAGHGDIDAVDELLESTKYEVGNKIPGHIGAVYIIVYISKRHYESLHPNHWVVKSKDEKVEIMRGELFEALYDLIKTE